MQGQGGAWPVTVPLYPGKHSMIHEPHGAQATLASRDLSHPWLRLYSLDESLTSPPPRPPPQVRPGPQHFSAPAVQWPLGSPQVMQAHLQFPVLLLEVLILVRVALRKLVHVDPKLVNLFPDLQPARAVRGGAGGLSLPPPPRSPAQTPTPAGSPALSASGSPLGQDSRPWR